RCARQGPPWCSPTGVTSGTEGRGTTAGGSRRSLSASDGRDAAGRGAAVREGRLVLRLDALLDVEHVREAGPGLLEGDRAAGLDLTPEVEEELRHVRTSVELALDARKRATVLPEGASLSRAAFGVTLGDQRDRAQGPVLLVLHAPTIAALPPAAIGPCADRRCGLSRRLPAGAARVPHRPRARRQHPRRP